MPILKRALGGVSLDWALELAGDVVESGFAKELEPWLVPWSLVCWLELPLAMGPVVALVAPVAPVVAAPSFLLLPLLSSELPPTSTNAPETNS